MANDLHIENWASSKAGVEERMAKKLKSGKKLEKTVTLKKK